jgi:hypothetical protein
MDEEFSEQIARDLERGPLVEQPRKDSACGLGRRAFAEA